MGVRTPFTMVERRRAVQCKVGHRPTNGWGAGVLPAPWAEGDVLAIVDPGRVTDEIADRLRRYPPIGSASLRPEPLPPRELFVGFYVVTYATSVDEGDAWYFRVDSQHGVGSDRLHVAYATRSNWDEDTDYMAAFDLVDTRDRDGLATRRELLAAGWPTPEDFTPDQHCPTCGRVVR